MSRVVDGWRDYRKRSAVQKFSGADHEALPETSALLCGAANAAGTAWERPPLALKLWLDGDRVVFCFSSKDFPLALWGSCERLTDSLLAVEQALCKGHCDWRENKVHSNGFTHSLR